MVRDIVVRLLNDFPPSVIFSADINWTKGKKSKIGNLSTGNHPELLKYGCPVEFGGISDRLSPEELLLSSVTACLVSTFLHLSDRFHLEAIDALHVSGLATVNQTAEGNI